MGECVERKLSDWVSWLVDKGGKLSRWLASLALVLTVRVGDW